MPSPFVLSNAKLWIGGYDFSGDVNALALKYGADMKETTTVGSSTRTRLAGLQFYSFQHEGYWSGGAGNVDDQVFNNIFAQQNAVMSIDGNNPGNVEGDVAYTGQVDLATYTPSAKDGDVFAFSVAGDSDGAPLVRGTLMASRTVVASGSGPVLELGAVGAMQGIYAGLHVLAPIGGTGGPTLTVTLQSAATSGFGSPTTRLTFNAAGAIGAQWQQALGAISDQYWRASYVITGSAPSIPFVVVAGIR